MSLVTLKEILKDTRKEHYAVPAFNFNGYEDAQGMVNCAAKMRTPIILMASMGATRYIGLKQIVGMIKGMAESVDVPICLHLDHATDIELIKVSITAGFTSVMIDASQKSYEENIGITKEVVAYAKQYGCSVEAELGRIGGREDDIFVGDIASTLTLPDSVPKFVKETGIDALAVAIGTTHGFYKSDPKLDFERLEKIANVTECPLVLHGGTGVSEEDLKKCVKIGISKINVGTEFKAAYSNTIRKAVNDISESEIDPRKYMKPVKIVCADITKTKIKVFGSANRA